MINIRQITGMTGKNERKNSLEVRQGLRKWRDRKVTAIKTSKLDVNRKVFENSWQGLKSRQGLRRVGKNCGPEMRKMSMGENKRDKV